MDIGNFSFVFRWGEFDAQAEGWGYLNNPVCTILFLSRGLLKIKCIETDKGCIQAVDYTVITARKIDLRDARKAFREIKEYPVAVFQHSNSFYTKILAELAYGLYEHCCGRSVSSFVYAYRALEAMSFALPLIYAKKAKTYDKAYEQLKKFFVSDKNSGELAFFKTALTDIFNDEEKRALFDFNVANCWYDAIESIVKERKCDVVKDVDVRFSLPMLDVIAFIISVRNAFFHCLSGKDNINISKMRTPSDFFENINPVVYNVLLYIINRVITRGIA